MELVDLVVLKYAPNTSWTQVVDAKGIEDIEVDLDKGTWSYKGWKDVEVGQARKIYLGNVKVKSGVIGVYDRTSASQLSSMISAAAEFTRESSLVSDR